jgi:hypothetical protein
MTTTPRPRLVPATAALVARELERRDLLAAELDVDVPPDWPPEHHDADTLRFMRTALEAPGAAGWWLR